GQAAIVKSGAHATIITYGALVHKAQAAARHLQDQNIDVEIIDLRTMRPLDFATIAQSIAKTNRALVLYEDNRFMGFGAEIAAQIAEQAFANLDAPVM